MKLGCQKHSPVPPPFELNREISRRSDKLSETSVPAVNRGRHRGCAQCVTVPEQMPEKRPRYSREASKIAVDKSPPEALRFLTCARGDVAPYTYHNCKMCLLRDMQEMISTVKLDDRATAACGSKNGRYELPRLSTSVKDNLWSNKSKQASSSEVLSGC
ncbi:Uncharacterized protein DBV15_05394 [Temnothorax longispinosus]|uniref:Uncharacterized protein n=1 Tax=Temnothorax longispinosus TaxID=300112 RepID=A0A4S2JB59_9HYME|nr:Uncharacterized protein DBV15_05394 [Temnothorax longispinosus]